MLRPLVLAIAVALTACHSAREPPLEQDAVELTCHAAHREGGVAACVATIQQFIESRPTARILAIHPIEYTEASLDVAGTQRILIIYTSSGREPWPRNDHARLLAFPCGSDRCLASVQVHARWFPDALVWTSLSDGSATSVVVLVAPS
jgi:hypothetical protein